jgi:hypothetical protein
MKTLSVIAVPYATLMNAKIIVTSIKKPYLAVDQHFLQFCMRSFIEKIRVDEVWYLTNYPDVADGGEGNAFGAAEHYIKHGYFENRLPYEIKVHEKWYLAQYPDVSAAVSKGEYASAQAHFETIGYAEGRFPYPNFSLLTIPIAVDPVDTEDPKDRKTNGAARREPDSPDSNDITPPSEGQTASGSTTI